MGLDMVPMGKPKPGHEERFIELFRILTNEKKQPVGLFERLKGKKPPARDELLQEWREIQIPSYETIKAPRVGRDSEADQWIKQKYEESDKSMSEVEFLKKYNGYYVIELAKEIDGVPVYISMSHDKNVFRGQFLTDCIDILGNNLVEEAWNTKLADEALDYGNRMMEVTEEIAQANQVEYLKSQRMPPENVDEDDIEWKVHIAYSLAQWLIFYGKNGHGYQADY